jgi:hypothetical protein
MSARVRKHTHTHNVIESANAIHRLGIWLAYLLIGVVGKCCGSQHDVALGPSLFGAGDLEHLEVAGSDNSLCRLIAIVTNTCCFGTFAVFRFQSTRRPHVFKVKLELLQQTTNHDQNTTIMR